MTAPARVGGLESVLLTLSGGQVRRGHDVRVVAVLDPPEAEHPVVTAFRRNGIDVVPLFVPTRSYLRERGTVAAIFREFGTGIVHTHGYRSDVIDGPVARRLGIPVVTTLHGFVPGGLKDRIYEVLQLRACRRFSAVVTVSTPIRDRVVASGIPPDRVHVIRNAWSPAAEALRPVAARAALKVPETGPRIGWVGRLSHEKGADVLLEALARPEAPRVAASFIGAGPEEITLAHMATHLGLDGRVTWHGLVPDAGRFYRAFDVFVLSSRTEGTPIGLLEAMSAGVPIVATRVGGVPDVLTDREAVLVPPENPAALAAGIAAALAPGSDAAARCQSAKRVLAERFAVDPWLDRYEELYRRVGAAL